jgi:hypothetical protein
MSTPQRSTASRFITAGYAVAALWLVLLAIGAPAPLTRLASGLMLALLTAAWLIQRRFQQQVSAVAARAHQLEELPVEGTAEVRPRFGTVTRTDGRVETVVFHPSSQDPDTFYAVLAGDESPINLLPGDDLHVDVIGPGQTVTTDATIR